MRSPIIHSKARTKLMWANAREAFEGKSLAELDSFNPPFPDGWDEALAREWQDIVDLVRRERQTVLAVQRKPDGLLIAKADPTISEKLKTTSAAPPPARKRQRYSIAEIITVKPPTWLLEPILPELGIGILYGQPNVGKSLIVLSWILSLSLKSHCLYVTPEDGIRVGPRVRAWLNHHKKTTKQVNAIIDTDEINLMSATDVRSFITTVQQGPKPALIAIDTLRRSMKGGEENSATDVDLFMEGCRAIVRAFNCFLLLVHHPGKDSKRGPRGSSNFRAACDIAIEVTSQHDGSMRLRCDKARHSEHFPDAYMKRIKVDDSVVAIKLEQPQQKTLAAPVMTNAEQQILKIFKASQLTILSRGHLLDAGIPEGSLDKALRKLQDAGKVNKLTRGKYELVSKNGAKQPK